MRRTSCLPAVAVTLSLVLASVSRAAPEAPSTQPSPADQPNSNVLVLPFESLGTDDTGNDQTANLARVIQRSLVLDLARSRTFHAVGGREVAGNPDAAVRAARDAGAGFAVWGNVQFAEGRIRVSGDVLDTIGDGQSVGTFKLTGTLREIFEIQDQLAEQVRSKLARATRAGAGELADGRNVAAPEAPSGEPLRRIRPRPFDPDWLTPPEDGDDDYGDLAWRYNYGTTPYWSIPYGYGNGYAYGGCYPFGYAYGGYHYSFYRPWRPLYQHRYFDYTYRGLPDRRTWYGFGPRTIRSFNGPVPLRWVR